tara:strand:- start:131 stop:1066 length:936 start_codon:yes stop_codon:yes gene_type:complete
MDYVIFKIKQARPTLRDVTIKNYTSFLKSAAKKVTQEEFKNLDFLKDAEKTKFFLDEYSFNTRRAILSAIVVALGATDDPYDNKKQYDTYLSELHGEYLKRLRSNKKSEKTKDQWTTMNELRKHQNQWRKKVNDDDIPNRDELSKRSQQILQNYLIVSLYTLMPPRRHIYSSVELISTIKFKKLSKISLKRNYLVFSKSLRKIFFHFGYQKSEYQASVNAYQKPPKKLFSILQLYLRFNRNRQWLLYNNKDEPMSSNTLGVQIKSLLGVGTTMIRKIYVTENTEAAHKQIQEIANSMGHSFNMAKSAYLKD